MERIVDNDDRIEERSNPVIPPPNNLDGRESDSDGWNSIEKWVLGRQCCVSSECWMKFQTNTRSLGLGYS